MAARSRWLQLYISAPRSQRTRIRTRRVHVTASHLAKPTIKPCLRVPDHLEVHQPQSWSLTRPNRLIDKNRGPAERIRKLRRGQGQIP
jgi:hypothetical protein